jgi:hypothetical protein
MFTWAILFSWHHMFHFSGKLIWIRELAVPKLFHKIAHISTWLLKFLHFRVLQGKLIVFVGYFVKCYTEDSSRLLYDILSVYMRLVGYKHECSYSGRILLYWLKISYIMAKRHMPSVDGSLDIISTPETRDKFCTIAVLLPYVLQKYWTTQTKVAYFAGIR